MLLCFYLHIVRRHRFDEHMVRMIGERFISFAWYVQFPSLPRVLIHRLMKNMSGGTILNVVYQRVRVDSRYVLGALW